MAALRALRWLQHWMQSKYSREDCKQTVHKQYYLLIFIETIVNDLDTADDKVYWIKKYSVSQQRSKKIYRAFKNKNKGNNVGWHCTSRFHRIDEFFHHVEPNDIQLGHWWSGKRQEWIWANYRFVLTSLKTQCSNLKVCWHFFRHKYY